MRRPRLTIRRSWFRWGIRTLVAMVFVCALGLGWLRWQLDGYRADWEAEQRVLSEMRKTGANFSVAMEPIGPSWLRTLAGPDRARYLERVRGFYFVASDPRLVSRYWRGFKRTVLIFLD